MGIPINNRVDITETSIRENAQTLFDTIIHYMEIYYLLENNSDIFKNVRILEIGGALGVHTGPGALSASIQKIND